MVIVGSGFTGFECARHLARKLREAQRCPSTSRSSRRSTTCCTHRCCPTWQAGWSTPDSSRFRSPTRCEAYRLIRGRVDSVDFDAHTVTFTDPEERATQPVVGSPCPDAGIGDPAVRRARSRGARPRAEVDGGGAVPARPRAGATRTGRCRRRSRPSGGAPDDRGRRRVVFGTELVVQLRALADSAAKQMDFDPADVKFVLLDLAEQVMPEVGEKLGAAAQRVLQIAWHRRPAWRHTEGSPRRTRCAQR